MEDDEFFWLQFSMDERCTHLIPRMRMATGYDTLGDMELGGHG